MRKLRSIASNHFKTNIKKVRLEVGVRGEARGAQTAYAGSYLKAAVGSRVVPPRYTRSSRSSTIHKLLFRTQSRKIWRMQCFWFASAGFCQLLPLPIMSTQSWHGCERWLDKQSQGEYDTKLPWSPTARTGKSFVRCSKQPRFYFSPR